MSLSLLEVLFDANRHLDGRFWNELCARLGAAGFGLYFREDGEDFTAQTGWRSVAEGHYPDATAHGYMLCADPEMREQARLQVNVFRVWDRHDEPWALPWDPETKLLLDARRARLEVQLLRVRKESTEFGEELVRAAAAVLDGILDDEEHGSLVLPDGAIEPYPEEAEEKTPSVIELSMGEEKTPSETTPVDEEDDDPSVARLSFELNCRETFTPQHAYDELLRRMKSLVPYKGFVPIRASTEWELFGFADPDASGLTILFRRLDPPAKEPPFKTELVFDLYRTFDPSPERIAKIHKLAHGLLDTLLDHLEADAHREP